MKFPTTVALLLLRLSLLSLLLRLSLLSLLLLATPLGAQVPSSNTSSVQLTWTPPSGLSGPASYAVFQGTNTGNYFTNYIAGTNTVLTVSNLTRGVTYYFAATATVSGVTSPYSMEATYTTLFLPASPSFLKVIVITP